MRRSFVMALVAALLGVVFGPVAGGAEGPGSCPGEAEEDRGLGPGGPSGETLVTPPRSAPRPAPRLTSGSSPGRLTEALLLPPAPTAGPLPAPPPSRIIASLARLGAHASRGPPALAV